MAQGRIRDLESVFHRSEAELAAALSDKRTLENDVAELRAQLAKVTQAVQAVGSPFTPTPAQSIPQGSWEAQEIPEDLTW